MRPMIGPPARHLPHNFCIAAMRSAHGWRWSRIATGGERRRPFMTRTTLSLLLTAGIGIAQSPPVWSPDRGDGTFKNPIIHADYSDPDAVRVGDDYFMVSSSFSAVPGLPILHSRDLVHWALVNHALPRLVPEAAFSTPRHGAGVWAPAIRHHAGK